MKNKDVCAKWSVILQWRLYYMKYISKTPTPHYLSISYVYVPSGSHLSFGAVGDLPAPIQDSSTPTQEALPSQRLLGEPLSRKKRKKEKKERGKGSGI